MEMAKGRFSSGNVHPVLYMSNVGGGVERKRKSCVCVCDGLVCL
jgi:hypothetical protein